MGNTERWDHSHIAIAYSATVGAALGIAVTPVVGLTVINVNGAGGGPGLGRGLREQITE